MKVKTVFCCQECGYTSAKWLGRCPDCSSWNSLVEESQVEKQKGKQRSWDINASLGPELLHCVQTEEKDRIRTGIRELDRVLGGGVVAGSVVLIGGDPGIGKSTILLQISDNISTNGEKILYVSGEESVKQTKLRANRLGTASENLYIVSETNLGLILEYVKRLQPKILVLDSIQVVYREDLTSSAGSVSQVRECAALLTSMAKTTGCSVFIVGHVTKEGALAGPRVLEHIVDTVLYFEGDRHASYRILRAVKNRFGSTNEIGIFEMTGKGLAEVKNPSELFLSDRTLEISGAVVTPTIEGSRPLVVEIQSLVAATNFGLPRRRSTGVDINRIILLVAVLERRAGITLANYDVFINVTGGIKIVEPSADLAIAAAIASSRKDIPAKKGDIIFGEIGLGGEIRAVNGMEVRISEAEKLGFKRCILPKANLKAKLNTTGIERIGVSTIKEAVALLLPSSSNNDKIQNPNESSNLQIF
ncbi:MAG: DNA repair protein RadA [Candidatus Omnitrophota bacterium]